ncbi:hypothetical protein ACFPM7_20895 [Actinokineospora guangxiensis]|uniref:Uncharacterized protein n=1 Tax=Actinokineospora guangxiensis TaxID=1490288 RepID=A0ABW0ESZ0_9PSEU
MSATIRDGGPCRAAETAARSSVAGTTTTSRAAAGSDSAPTSVLT